jgi:glutamyl-tRNA synthetase
VSTSRSRLAPSPTGALHLGNAFSFLITYALAKQKTWDLLFRLEDLDGPRIKIETMQESEDILRWLGISWNGDVLLQSEGLEHSKSALEKLILVNKSYHCSASRKQIESAISAPHTDELQGVPEQRPIDLLSHNKIRPCNTNWRFVSSGHARTIVDEAIGKRSFVNSDDFIIWTKNNTPSYQLAVVVDDHRQGVTDVVRGNDLLSSASKQEELYHALGWAPPRWWHIPLIVGEDGKRLAKRHGDSRIAYFRAQGVPVERIIGLLAYWSGITQNLTPLSMQTFTEQFQITNLTADTIFFSAQEKIWLLDS